MISMTLSPVCRLYPYLLLLLSLTSCSRNYKVEGMSSVTGFDGKTLYLKTLENGEWVTVDSADVEHGLFRMSGSADSAKMVTLFIDSENIMPLVLEHGTIEVSISNTQLEAKGTPLNNRLYDFIQRRNELEMKMDELDRREARAVLDGGDLDEVRAQLREEGEQLLKEMNEHAKLFISENFTNVLGPSVFMMIAGTLPYPLITPPIEELMKTAPLEFKNNPMVKEFLEKARENKTLLEEQRRLQQHTTANSAR